MTEIQKRNLLELIFAIKAWKLTYEVKKSRKLKFEDKQEHFKTENSFLMQSKALNDELKLSVRLNILQR